MEEYKKHFQNICDSLSEIYTILNNNNIDDSELSKATTQLYNVLNRIESTEKLEK